MKNPIKVFFICISLGLITSYLAALLGNHIGILFSGPATFFAIFVGTIAPFVLVLITEWLFRRKAKRFTYRLLVFEIILTSVVAVSFLSWYQARDFLKILMNPVPVPSGVHVHNGGGFLFSTYVHFSARPEAIGAIIQSHRLTLSTNDSPEKIEEDKMVSGWFQWWRPATMSNPKFFMRHHESQAVQGWTEGWWINGATNEVYAFISG